MILTRGLTLGRARLALRNLLRAVFLPQPDDGAVGALPLILVDGARQEPLDVGSLRRHAAADHLGDRTGHDHRRQIGIEHPMRALHRAFGAGLAEFLLAEPGDHDRQFVRRQRVGIVQHRGDRQILAADRAVDDDLHALDRGEGIDRPPVAAGAIVIEHQHQIISSALRFLAWASICFLYFSRKATLSFGRVFPDAGSVALADLAEKFLHLVEAALIGERGIDDLRQRAGAGDAEQRPRRNQIGEIQRGNCKLFCLLHHRRSADGEIRLELADSSQIHSPAKRGTGRGCLLPPAIRDRHRTTAF